MHFASACDPICHVPCTSFLLPHAQLGANDMHTMQQYLHCSMTLLSTGLPSIFICTIVYYCYSAHSDSSHVIFDTAPELQLHTSSCGVGISVVFFTRTMQWPCMLGFDRLAGESHSMLHWKACKQPHHDAKQSSGLINIRVAGL